MASRSSERLLGHLAVGRQIVGRVLVDDVNRILVDEGLDVHRMVRFDPHRIQVGILDDDVLLVLVLVAPDQIRALDQAKLRIDRLHVDAVMRVFVQLIEADPFAGAGRRI